MIYETWLINNLCIWAIYASFKEGMIFGWLGELIEIKLYERYEEDKVDYWLKPFFRCPVCMPSIWGSLGFFIFAPIVWYYWPLYVITMVGLNYIISQLISKTIKIDND